MFLSDYSGIQIPLPLTGSGVLQLPWIPLWGANEIWWAVCLSVPAVLRPRKCLISVNFICDWLISRLRKQSRQRFTSEYSTHTLARQILCVCLCVCAELLLILVACKQSRFGHCPPPVSQEAPWICRESSSAVENWLQRHWNLSTSRLEAN